MRIINNLDSKSEVKINFEETQEELVFDVFAKNKIYEEYALVLSDGNLSYTAGVFPCNTNKKIIAKKEKANFATEISLIEIERETYIFKGNLNRDENEVFDVEPDIVSEIEENIADIDIFEEYDFIDNNLNQETPEANESDKSEPNELSYIFESFNLLEDVKEGEEFFKFDEYAAKKNDLKIRFGSSNVPLAQLFLDYRNPFSNSGDYPEKLIGTQTEDNIVKYYIFGSYGRKNNREQPFLGATGFVYYKNIISSDMGYWLMYVNAKTGRISIPNEKVL